ncbi:MAG: WD40 repeat domain-containing protein [Vicingaceae bacterium]
MKVITFILVSLLAFNTYAQNINENFEKWIVEEKPINITGIDLSPDGKEVALVCGKKTPLMIYDLASQSIVKEIDIKDEYSGYNVHYSPTGKYLLIQERVYENNPKKAKKSDYHVVDLQAGKLIHKFKKISDAKISPDESKLYVLEKDQLEIRELPSGKILKKRELEAGRNAMAISPDGEDLAVVVKPTKEELKEITTVRNDRKALKAALKYRFAIAIFDTETLERKKMVNEIYDNINQMHYSKDGKKLLCFNVAQNSYINVIDASTYQPSREGYLSRTTSQPDFSYGWNGEYFGISTVEKWPSVNIYKVESASVVDYYNTQMKIWKNIKKKVFGGTNTSFVFLPDERHVLIAYGNTLIKWKVNK